MCANLAQSNVQQSSRLLVAATSRHARSRERSRHAAPFSGETAGRSCPWLGCVYVHNTQRLMGRFMGIWGFFVHCRHTLNRAKWLSEFSLHFITLGKLLHAISHSTQVLLARLHSAWKSVRKLTFFSKESCQVWNRVPLQTVIKMYLLKHLALIHHFATSTTASIMMKIFKYISSSQTVISETCTHKRQLSRNTTKSTEARHACLIVRIFIQIIHPIVCAPFCDCYDSRKLPATDSQEKTNYVSHCFHIATAAGIGLTLSSWVAHSAGKTWMSEEFNHSPIVKDLVKHQF